MGGFFALAMGSSVCRARMAVEQITKSGAIFARLGRFSDPGRSVHHFGWGSR